MNQTAKHICTFLFSLVICVAAITIGGCGKKAGAPPARPQMQGPAATRRKPPAAAAKKAAATAAKTTNVEEEKPDLIKEAGFDMIYPNFNRKTGRRDPFVPVSIMESDWDTLKRLAGEKFRVIGTAMTPSGQIAMIEVGEQTKIVREGDVLENGSIVKAISEYDVTLERNKRELRLTMFTRKRIARIEPEETQLKIKEMDNINDLYKKYLEDKYGEEYAGQEGETTRPPTFNDYVEGNSNRKKEGPSKRMF